MPEQQKRNQPDPSQAESRKKPPPTTIVVRYGRMSHVGEFHLPRSMETVSCGSRLVVQTDRGVEIGQPVNLTRSNSPHAIGRDQMRAYVKNSGPETLRFQAGRVLRQATPEDLIEQRHIEAQKPDKLEICRRLVEEHGLDMRLVDCEHVFGGERIVFYFMADSRVDFRSLVKDLADEFQTRIEMRQIGARDEARLVADYETCGRECCCKNFLKILKPVSMRMAKIQKATLDPSKVSGRCGRLKCCLRYEHETYEELESRLPHVGDWVNSTEGEGVVVDRQILTQLLQVQGEAGQVFAVGFEQLLAPGERPPAKEQSGAGREEWRPFDGDQPPGRPTGSAQEAPLAKEVPSRPASAERSGADAGPAGQDESEEAPAKSKRRRRRRRGRRGRGRRSSGE